MEDNTPIIEGRHLFKKYVLHQGDYYALNDVSISVQSGEYVAVTGHSGSGKSTLMNILGSIDAPTSGEILFEGISIKDYTEKQLAQLRNRSIGYVFQSFYLEPNYTVGKNVEMPLLIAGYDARERKKRIQAVLEQVGMEKHIHQKAYMLSGGEKQRVSIARALVCNPKLILADEPCGNLDSENTAIVMDIFHKLHQEQKTIILITHSNEDASQAERQIIMKDGKILS